MGVTGSAASENRFVGGVVDGAGEAKSLGETAAPLEWGLAATAVVGEGAAREVVGATQHRPTVVLDRVDAHHPEPGHVTLLRSNPGGGCNRVPLTCVMAHEARCRRGVPRGRSLAALHGA